MTARPSLDLGSLDALLDRYESASADVASRLLTLEDHPAYALIKHTAFTGETARQHAAALALAPTLWARAARLNGAITEARRLRDSAHGLFAGHPLDELTAVLAAPNVALDDEPGQRLVTLGELATLIDGGLRAIDTAVREIDAAWQSELPTLHSLLDTLRTGERDAVALGLDPQHEVGGLRARIQHTLDQATTDPIGHRELTAALTAEVAGVAARLGQLATQRQRLPADLAGARRALAELRELIARGRTASVNAREKVREAAGLLAPLDDEAIDDPERGLAVGLVSVEQITGDWRRQRAALDSWTVQADELRRRAATVVQANEAPVAARNELRGRLDAYRAMAGARGAAEDVSLDELYHRAHDLLHEAPADLRAAAGLVVQYITAVRSRTQPTPPARRTGDDQR